MIILMKPAYLTHLATAEAAIRDTGERLTQPRVAVLACLLSSEHATTHLDVAAMLADHHAVDRVTVYRVLEWLVNHGIAHRIAGDDRVWRFMISNANLHNTARNTAGKTARNANAHAHAHFTCNTCGQTFCLDKVQPKMNVKLPTGFRTTEVDLKIRGLCAECK